MEYNCTVCKNISNQKSHHESHLKTKKHKKEIKKLILELKALSKDELLEKYSSSNINDIVNKLETYESEINEDYLNVMLSNNDTLKDKIHYIHNFLHNSGVGHGMAALKIFNLFYGLKKIELEGYFDKTGLDEYCRFSNILNLFNNTQYFVLEKVYNMFKTKILEEFNNNKLSFLFYNIPKSVKAKTIKNLINLIEDLCNTESKLNVKLSGKIYEYFIGHDETAISELGVYFTDRHITKYIYEVLLVAELDDNNNIHSMIDMFGGSGGFTIGYIDYLKHKYNTIKWQNQIGQINHFDKNEDIIKSAMLEFYCLAGEFPKEENMRCVNSFKHNFDNKKYHYVITNPPYGGDKNKKSENVQNLELIKKEIENEFKSKYNIRNMNELSKHKISNLESQTIKQYYTISMKLKDIEISNNDKNVNLKTCNDIYKEYAEKYKLFGNDKEAISLIMMMALLEENGTSIGVLKEGIFFDKKYSSLRKCLVENFNVTTIVSIPVNQFKNTSTKTSIIMFKNTKEKTSNINFYKLNIDKNQQTSFMRDESGIYHIKDIKDKITNVYHDKVSVGHLNNIISKNYSFNSKDYNMNDIVCDANYNLADLSEKVIPLNKQFDNKLIDDSDNEEQKEVFALTQTLINTTSKTSKKSNKKNKKKRNNMSVNI